MSGPSVGDELRDWISGRYGTERGAKARFVDAVREEMSARGLEVEDSTVYRWAAGGYPTDPDHQAALAALGFNADPLLREFFLSRLQEEDYTREEIETAYPLEKMPYLAELVLRAARDTLNLNRLHRAPHDWTQHSTTSDGVSVQVQWIGGPNGGPNS